MVDEVQRLAVGVGVAFENPAGDLGAAVGEGDSVELVFDDGGVLAVACTAGVEGAAFAGGASAG